MTTQHDPADSPQVRENFIVPSPKGVPLTGHPGQEAPGHITLSYEDARLIGARLVRIRGPMSLEEFQALERFADQLDAADLRRRLFPAPFIIGPGGEEYPLTYEETAEFGADADHDT